MKTFLVFWGAVTSDLAAMIAGVSTSRDAFLSRGDIAGSIYVGGPIGGRARLSKVEWTAGPSRDYITL